ncbi:MAG: nuclear transport factor 2 family protein [Chloroflexi bacterium]|nr:nuclear transport factor 2 family protein [Chloroflexota bacterium]
MSPSIEETQEEPQLLTDDGRVPGSRVILAVGGVAVAISAVVIAAFVLFADVPNDPDVACVETPQVCGTLRDYATAWNNRDAGGMLTLMTDRGLQTVLRVASEEELIESFSDLPRTDLIEELRIASVTLDGDTAEVRIQYRRLNQSFDDAYQLVQSDGRWLIDGWDA